MGRAEGAGQDLVPRRTAQVVQEAHQDAGEGAGPALPAPVPCFGRAKQDGPFAGAVGQVEDGARRVAEAPLAEEEEARDGAAEAPASAVVGA